jgi:hypothetical protein
MSGYPPKFVFAHLIGSTDRHSMQLCLCIISCLHVHSATASVLELRPAALRSELALRALRV